MAISTNMKIKIKSVALDLFSKQGYHATSIRDIAKEVNCSLPMVYYYFQNKEGLFYDLVFNDFMLLNERLNNSIVKTNDIKEMYIKSIVSRITLTGDEMKLYRLALKTTLGVYNLSHIQEELIKWEQQRFAYAQYLLKKYFDIDNPLYGNLLSRVASNLIKTKVVYEQDLSIENATEELRLIFSFFESIGRN